MYEGIGKMPKIAKELHALAVKNLSTSGLHAVGGVSGLYLCIGKNGSRSWILRTMIGSKRHDIGLGSYPSISLSLARVKSTEIKESIKKNFILIKKSPLIYYYKGLLNHPFKSKLNYSISMLNNLDWNNRRKIPSFNKEGLIISEINLKEISKLHKLYKLNKK
jgi:hypothetical protein